MTRYEDHPEGVVGREEGAEEAQEQPELFIQMGQGPQNRLLAEKPGKGKDAGQGQGGDGDGNHGDLEFLAPVGGHDKEVIGAEMMDEDPGA